MKKTSILLFLISICISLNAQNAILKGKVKDTKTNEALIGVNISIEGSGEGTTTDIDGNYEFSVPISSKKLVFSYTGYDNKVEIVTLKENETKIINIIMGEAQSLLDEVVVTSSKFERKIGEETVTIDIIKPVSLEKQNITNVSDALQRSPGVTVVDGQVNIRGGSGWSYGAGSRVLLLMDDLPILQADAGFPSWSSFPIENIGQVEIIKGAASALYGSSAMNGIINVRTAYPTSEPYAKFSVFGTVFDNPNTNDYSVDSFGILTKTKLNKQWWKQDSINLVTDNFNTPDTTIANPFNKRPYEAGASFAYREKLGKNKKIDFVGGGMFLKKQGHKWGDNETRMRVSINIKYKINEKISIGINSNITTSKSQTFFLWGGDGIGKYLPAAITGIPTESRSFRVSLDPFIRYADSKGNSHKFLGRYIKTAIDNSNAQDNSNDYFYGEYQYQRRVEKWKFAATCGIVASHVISKAQLFGDTIHVGTNVAGYFQLDKKFFNRLNISYGFRFEMNSIDKKGREIKPVSRVGINVECAKYTFVRASFGQGYRFPTIAEKFTETKLSPNFSIYPNPALQSEKGLSAELGIKQGVKLGKYLKGFIDVAGFYTQYDNMIEFNVVPPPNLGFIAQNVGNTRIYGAEVTLGSEGKIANKYPITLAAGYTYIVPQYRKYDESKPEFQSDVASYNVLKYRFRHQFNGACDMEFKGFLFGLTAQYFSFMENLDQVLPSILSSVRNYRISHLKKGSSINDLKPKFKGDFILDARIGYHFKKDNCDYNFSFLVRNITNQEYSLRPAIMEPPRSFAFRLDFTWK